MSDSHSTPPAHYSRRYKREVLLSAMHDEHLRNAILAQRRELVKLDDPAALQAVEHLREMEAEAATRKLQV
jgi:hypothetical protein